MPSCSFPDADGRPKVLLIEDHKDFQGFVTAALAGLGVQCRGVTTAREGIRSVADWKPDLVLLDLKLPDLNGIEILKSIRAQGHSLLLPVICLTADCDMRRRVETLGHGADDFLTKPVHPMELAARVGAKLRSKRLQDSLAQENASLRSAQSKPRFFSEFIVYDFRNLLLPVQGALRRCLDSLRSPGHDAGRMFDSLQRCHENVVCVREMIEGLLDAGRLDGRTMASNVQAADPAALLEECLSRTAAYASAMGAVLDATPPEGRGRIAVDREAVLRVLEDLAKIAIFFASPQDRRVGLSVRLDGGAREWVFCVEYRAMAVSEDRIEELFERGGRARGGASDRVPGSGLGLTLCKLAVEAQGGRILVENGAGRAERFLVALKAV